MPGRKNIYPKKIQSLTLPIKNIKGVGPKRAGYLSKKGLHSILDLFYFTPIRYEDRTKITPIAEVDGNIPMLVKGRVVLGKEERLFKSRKSIFRIIIRDHQEELELIWFRYKKPYIIKYADQNSILYAFGKVRCNYGKMQMVHPDIFTEQEAGTDKIMGFNPVYSEVAGISQKILRRLIRTCLEKYMDYVTDPIPERIISKTGLPDLHKALEFLHFPTSDASFKSLNDFRTPAHRRLLFDRFFTVMLLMAFRRNEKKKIKLPGYSIPKNMERNIRQFFSFEMTLGQNKAFEEIQKDFTKGRPMNRLLMGDVGCGKTAVASLAAYVNAYNKRQTALMAPTQILAKQHMEYFSGLPRGMGFRPVLLTGEGNKKDYGDIAEKIGNGFYNIIIGTHSLIREDISYKDLGLVIIDEQHRFGVRQRLMLENKGNSPHLLVMTATPIPRSMAITLFGDMDISIIKEFPKGRLPVETYITDRDRKRWVFDTLRKRLQQGEQGFVICPVIEGSEEQDLKSAIDMEKGLQKILSPGFRVRAIHGRLNMEERISLMEDFKGGHIHILVGTTVLEVGIDVPNATLMIIEHPERFGLAQLHQLRGRVGRGTKQGLCILIKEKGISESALSRLETLVKNHDGFKIAQKDLELRGQGEFLGTKQSGAGEIDFIEIFEDPELFQTARREAYKLVELDQGLVFPEHTRLKLMIDSVLSNI